VRLVVSTVLIVGGVAFTLMGREHAGQRAKGGRR
jgi:hypothetical protein